MISKKTEETAMKGLSAKTQTEQQARAETSRQARRPKPRKQLLDQPSALTVLQAEHWAVAYDRHARIYAWGFLAVVLTLIFRLIWWKMGEVNDDERICSVLQPW